MDSSYSRICLAGEDLDWTGGNAILCNINLFTKIKITKNNFSDNIICIYSNLIGEKHMFQEDELEKYIYTGNDFDYVVGALKIFQRLYFKVKNLSIDL